MGMSFFSEIHLMTLEKHRKKTTNSIGIVLVTKINLNLARLSDVSVENRDHTLTMTYLYLNSMQFTHYL